MLEMGEIVDVTEENEIQTWLEISQVILEFCHNMFSIYMMAHFLHIIIVML